MNIKLISGITAVSIAGGLFLSNHVSNNETLSYTPRSENHQPGMWNEAAEHLRWMKANQVTGEINPADVIKARSDVQEFKSKRSALGLQWSDRGPDNVGGRTRAFLIDKDDPTHVFAGSVTGGLFVSYNSGGLWEPVNDLFDNLSISCLTQDANGKMYMGTGSSFDNLGGSGSSGAIGGGMFTSTDDGKTWTPVASTIPTVNSSTGDWVYINRIIVDPNNVNNIYAATYGGLQISTDAGATWYEAIFANCPDATIPLSGTGQDLELSGSGRLFVTLNGKAYFSDDPTAICSYTNLATHDANGVFLSSSGRMELAASTADPNVIWACAVGGDSQLDAIYKSTDNGDSWAKKLEPIPNYFTPMSNDINGQLVGQGLYDLALAAHPTNANTVYVGGVQLWKYDGNLTRIASEFEGNGGFSFTYVHSDKHLFAFDQIQGIMYVLSDGGVTKSFDGGNSWFAANRGYNVTQFYDMAYGKKGQVMGGSQDNGTQYIDGTGNTAYEASEVRGGDGFDCDISSITGTMFASVYWVDVARSDDGLSWSNIGMQYANTGVFHTVTKLWETYNDPTSQDSIVFAVTETKQGIGTGNGTSKTFSGTLVPLQASGNVINGSVWFEAGNISFDDSDGDGVISTPNGIASINYTDLSFTVTFTSAPVQNLAVWAYFTADYQTGDTLFLQSKTGSKTVQHVLSQALPAGDSIKVQDPIQSIFAISSTVGGAGVAITRDALDFTKTELEWINLNVGYATSIEFSADGNHMYIAAGGLYRVSGLNNVYSQSDVTANVTSTLIYNPGGRSINGIAVDQTNPENVMVCLGNYGNTQYVHLSTSAASTTGSSSFTSVQGDLPAMPTYDAEFDVTNNSIVVLGTEHGVYATSNIYAGTVSWSDENNGMSHVPTFEVDQQKFNWQYSQNHETFYLGTHGRGIFHSESLVNTPEISHYDFSSQSIIGNLVIFPNPVADHASFSINSKKSGFAAYYLTDINGKLVQNNSVKLTEGENTVNLDVDRLESGTYFLIIDMDGISEVGKLLKIK